MRVVLAKAPFHFDDADPQALGVVPSAGIYVLASIARDLGFDVAVCDESSWNKGMNAADWVGSADVVGLSVHTMNWALTRQMVAQIKAAYPETVIVLGGVHPTHCPEHVLQSSAADLAFRGEAEAGWSALLTSLRDRSNDYEKLTNICISAGSRVITGKPFVCDRFGDNPLPAFDLVPEGKYITMPVETSRGCAGRCSFCSIPAYSRWTGASLEQVAERIRASEEHSKGKFLTDDLYISDNCFTIDRARAAAICHYLADAGFSGRVVFKSRIRDLLDDELMGAMCDLKPAQVHVGVECGYDRGLKLVRKGVTIEQVMDCANRIDHSGLSDRIRFSFIIGLPWEDESDCLATMRFAASLADEYGVAITTSWWVPLPSELWDRGKEFGISVTDDIYDARGWLNDTFWATHPALTIDAKQRLDERFQLYEQQGINLCSN